MRSLALSGFSALDDLTLRSNLLTSGLIFPSVAKPNFFCFWLWPDHATTLLTRNLYGLVDLFNLRRSKMVCALKECEAEAKKILCADHLLKPKCDLIQFNEKIHVKPTMFYKAIKLDSEYRIANSVVAAIQLVATYNLDQGKSKGKRMRRLLEASFAHNRECVKVHRLKRLDSVEGCMYAPSESICEEMKVKNSSDWKSTEHFANFSPLENYHQLFICD